MKPRILIVLTSHGRLGDTGRRTGFWLEELAAPCYAFLDADATVTLASPQGGQPPLDPESVKPEHQSGATRRFAEDRTLQDALSDTVPLARIDPGTVDAAFYPGGHGPLWDLVDDPHSIALIETLCTSGRPVAALCHGPVVLLNARNAENEPLVAGRAVTSFTNAEETAIGLADAVPELLEDALKARGAQFSSAEPFAAHAVREGALITGQNPASSTAVARHVLEAVAELTYRPMTDASDA